MDMRRIVFVLLGLLLISAMACGQSADPFFPSGAGVVLVYESQDAGGRTESFKTDSVAEFSGDFMHGRATVMSTVVSGDTILMKTEFPMVFDRGEVMIDMASLMEKAMQEGMRQAMSTAGAGESDEELEAMKEVMEKITVKGESRGIPADVEVGMELPDYEIEIKVMFMTSRMGCRDRRVTGRETVTTPAGTFDCYVVEETMTAKAMMVNEKTRQVSWYARGIGLVKQQTWEKKKLMETTVLTAVR